MKLVNDVDGRLFSAFKLTSVRKPSILPPRSKGLRKSFSLGARGVDEGPPLLLPAPYLVPGAFWLENLF